MGYLPGSVGETSVLMILIGAAILLITGIASWRIMLSSVIGASLMGFIFNIIGSSTNELFNFPWTQHLLVGGFAFGMVFMATDPVSAAQTTTGKWIYGFLIGIFAILIRVINPTLPEGVMMAILLMNVFAPTIDHYVIASNIKRRKKRLQKVKA
jgi:Na+-transporting NADH:ubiquinone oxidoreductase subunit B